jgi:hypothetical protein
MTAIAREEAITRIAEAIAAGTLTQDQGDVQLELLRRYQHLTPE